MSDLDRFYDLEEIIPEKKAEQQKLEGQLEATKEQFKKVTGVDTIEAADAKIETLEEEIKAKTAKRDQMVNRFFRKYPFLKEEE